jgi:two-component system, chemotaxis family, protein-glutamate methylesterase/glutaminase
MPSHGVVVIGASAGGLEALTKLVAGLPRDLSAALFVVVHVSPTATSSLPAILSRHGPLPARHPTDDEPIEAGTIYVAPPDHHLLVRPGRVRLARGPRENGHRPAVDPLFRSAALHYGPRVIGVVLSGNLDDGSAGLVAVKARGGVALVQEPSEASFPSMPRSAVDNVAVDACLPVAALADEIARRARAPVRQGGPVSGDMRIETDMAEVDSAAYGDTSEHPGTPSVYGCPECGGVLWELQEGDLMRFRCRVGHAYSSDSLLAEQGEQLESALWAALRALDEERSLSERLAARARERRSGTVGHFERRARDAATRGDLIRSVLNSGQTGDRPKRGGNGRRGDADPAGGRRPG